ncbi:MAG: hypothetical protein AB8B58_05240 [Roseobacter sp.]
MTPKNRLPVFAKSMLLSVFANTEVSRYLVRVTRVLLHRFAKLAS